MTEQRGEKTGDFNPKTRVEGFFGQVEPEKSEPVRSAEKTPTSRAARSNKSKRPASKKMPGRSAAALPVLTSEQQMLVADNIGLVGLHMKNRVPTPSQPTRFREYEDLFQEGCMALTRAAASYDANRHGPFASYALPRIRGAIHAALHEHFTMIRLPPRVYHRAKKGVKQQRHPAVKGVQELLPDIAQKIPASDAADGLGETIRHAIHRRYTRAVERALTDLQARSWRQRNPVAIMRRIASERLLISHEKERTPLRQIARECDISCGRVSAYERELIKTIREYFADDPQLPLLMRFACDDAQSYNGIIDDHRRDLLTQADLDDFIEKFAQFDRPKQAEIIYCLIEQSTRAVSEVVLNLYRLTLRHDPLAIPEVA